jgi:ArsR family transcriptional regulator
MKSQTVCPPLPEETVKNSEQDLQDALNLLGLLSNPIRLKIALLLSKREMRTCHLESVLGAEQTLISHHLRAFKDLDMLSENRRGKWRYYSIKK